MIGVVLAGGRSTRLGQDKVRLRLPGDGRGPEAGFCVGDGTDARQG